MVLGESIERDKVHLQHEIFCNYLKRALRRLKGRLVDVMEAAAAREPEDSNLTAVWKEWRDALGGRAINKKEAEEEGDLLGAFFYCVYEFLFSFSNPPPIVHRPCVLARYAIRFVPAASSPVDVVSCEVPVSPVVASVSSSFSVVSSANFVIAVAVLSASSIHCMPTT